VFLLFDLLMFDGGQELTLSPNSRSYSLWKVIPVPIYMEFYLFNWTNPEEIHNPAKKPILKELGPYVFRYCSLKLNYQVSWILLTSFPTSVNTGKKSSKDGTPKTIQLRIVKTEPGFLKQVGVMEA